MPHQTEPEFSPLRIAPPLAIEALRDVLLAEPRIAVDTESDSLYSYFEKVCLLQFSTPADDFIVDPLATDVAPLAGVFADARIEKIFHAVEYDILCMKRDYHFEFVNIFDTMVAARILGWKNIGLGNTLQTRFGVSLNKKMQRADWGHRPLTEEHLQYAREDTHYLVRLRDLQMEELDKVGRLAEAREEFARLTRVEPTPRKFDPEAYWNIDGARNLDPIALGILRELFLWRDGEARKRDRPPFKVLSDSTMMYLASARPTSVRMMRNISGVSSFVIDRYAHPILQSVERGHQSPQKEAPHPHARGDGMLDNPARTRLGKLKEWRKERAEARGVEPDVIVSNDVLAIIARHNPRTLESLITLTKLGEWKANEYGEEMLNILHKKKK
jgi:ribonuclease D